MHKLKDNCSLKWKEGLPKVVLQDWQNLFNEFWHCFYVHETKACNNSQLVKMTSSAIVIQMVNIKLVLRSDGSNIFHLWFIDSSYGTNVTHVCVQVCLHMCLRMRSCYAWLSAHVNQIWWM